MTLQERTALVILVPEADPLVEQYRRRHDPSAAEGIPAHITVLYPFLISDRIDKDLIDELRHLFFLHSCFYFSLVETRRFPDTLFLAPAPEAPFKELTQAVVGRYPETEPYGGMHQEIIPHLTIAQLNDPLRLNKIENEFNHDARKELPIHSRAERVWLMEKQEGVWKQKALFELNRL